MASGKDLAVSDAALWMLLLLRLTAVTTDERLELRNSKITPSAVYQSLADNITRCHSNLTQNLRCIRRPA